MSMMTRTFSLCLTALVAVCGGAAFAAGGEDFVMPEGGWVQDGGDVGAAPLRASLSAMQNAAAEPDAQAVALPRPKAFEYSDGYRIRWAAATVAF
jgi:hypothetical protein